MIGSVNWATALDCFNEKQRKIKLKALDGLMSKYHNKFVLGNVRKANETSQMLSTYNFPAEHVNPRFFFWIREVITGV